MFHFFCWEGGWAKFQTKAQNWILPGRLGTHMGDQEIGAISRRFLDNLGQLVYMQIQEAIRHKNAPITDKR